MAKSCNLCPRNCNIDRTKNLGFCKMPDSIYVARAALHFWEEPCISGTEGSGTVFFSGCNLRCVYCQNHDIAHECFGKEITVQNLSDIFLNLQSQNANNINLVTPTHYIHKIVPALKQAKQQGLKIPVVYNSSGYEKTETLLTLKNTVEVVSADVDSAKRDIFTDLFVKRVGKLLINKQKRFAITRDTRKYHYPRLALATIQKLSHFLTKCSIGAKKKR